MADTQILEPDVGFIKEVGLLGGEDAKKCYQCATCSTACPISPDDKPFPRKEMIAASWGLKDRLVANHDIWLCHNCGDCNTLCPRGAKPGDVLSAVRSMAITEYATPKALGRAVNDPKKLPLLLLVPAIWFALLASITVFGRDPLTNMLGELWTHGVHPSTLAHTNFVSTWLVDLTFVPLATLATLVFFLGLKRFIGDMHQNALISGKTDIQKIEAGGFIASLIKVIPTILLHNKFNDCSENKERGTSHLMVLYSFIALAIVTGFAFLFLYVFHMPGPISQMNPVKWLANVAGVTLCVGAFLMLKSRLSKKDQLTSYKDWALIALVLGLGVTGMVTEITRLVEWRAITFGSYYVHLIFVFALFAYLPFSKLAHLVYRTVAMAYDNYIGRK